MLMKPASFWCGFFMEFSKKELDYIDVIVFNRKAIFSKNKNLRGGKCLGKCLAHIFDEN
jgi:hypothetical protein